MASDNIFSGLKVVDLASFIAGPGAATILSDFGADVIKVEPPVGDFWRNGHKLPPQPQAKDAYQWHLANRNKRGMVLNLKTEEGRSLAAVLGVPEKVTPYGEAAADTAELYGFGELEPVVPAGRGRTRPALLLVPTTVWDESAAAS